MRASRLISVFSVGIVALLWAGTVSAENPYVDLRIPLGNGDELVRATTPLPPPEIKAPVAHMPESPELAPVLLPSVPAFNWSFGCAATSAAMLAGYYDNNGFPNMYAGPAYGGVCPMTNAVWGSGHCPLSATEQGKDGLGVRGHVDDYWVSEGSTANDPYITGGWAQHTYGDCTGDYMKTNQSAWGNKDGSTILYYLSSGLPYSAANDADGGYGLRLFLESRGYTVVSHFTQLIDGWGGNTNGMTFAEYRAEIDSGRPVLIHVEGHTMLGYGYDTAGSLIWLHDTWDYSNHTMQWGGWYPYYTQQLNHWAVTCVELEGASNIFEDGFESGNTSAWSN